MSSICQVLQDHALFPMIQHFDANSRILRCEVSPAPTCHSAARSAIEGNPNMRFTGVARRIETSTCASPAARILGAGKRLR